jgi:GDP-4-dehydro-6-deoxy-D-mannose reductase
MRVLVTGVDSFIGSHLAEALVRAGDEVFGLSHRRTDSADGITRQAVDVVDATAVAALVAQTKPERVFHLAAQSKIVRSFEDPMLTLSTNVVGSAGLFEALRVHAPRATVVSVGSSSEYGDAAKQIEFLREDSPLLPTSPYAVSKVAQGKLATVYARAYGMPVMHIRVFAILGPRKEGDALSDFCRNVVAIERGDASELVVGTTSTVRDFTDVRDCVEGLRIAADRGEPGATYNLCSGTAHDFDDVIAELKRATKAAFVVRRDPARVRPVDDARIVGNPEKLNALGYQPRISLADTIATTLEYWRSRAQSGK